MELQRHDIVQIVDSTHVWFPCLLIVSEVKSWGIQGFCLIPTSNDGSESPGSAYLRVKFDQIEKVGRAVVAPRDEE